jgi:Kef-type K+ transport system membrane component KefB
MPEPISTLSTLDLNHLFFAIVFLLISAHFWGYIFHRFRMPRVVGEIFGGVILGPTGLGHFFPGLYGWLFNGFAGQGLCMSFVYWFGLVLLMFISGFEIQKHFTKNDAKLIGLLVVGSTLIPLILSVVVLRFVDVSFLMGSKQSLVALYVIVAIAVSVTSIPVISRIFIDLGMMQTKFANIILSTSTIHDLLLWIAFAIAGSMVQIKNQSITGVAITTVVTILFFVLTFLVGAPFIKAISRSRFNIIKRASGAGYILIICFIFSAMASVLNVNIIFGALLAGIAVGLLPPETFEKEKSVVRETSLAFFIPLYFAIVGLKLNLLQDFNLSLFLIFLGFSSCCQLVGTWVVTRLQGFTSLSWTNIFMALNAKGGPGIVLATAAYDLGIINASFFVVLVLNAVVTSLFAGAWFRHILSKGLPLMERRLPA